MERGKDPRDWEKGDQNKQKGMGRRKEGCWGEIRVLESSWGRR